MIINDEEFFQYAKRYFKKEIIKLSFAQFRSDFPELILLQGYLLHKVSESQSDFPPSFDNFSIELSKDDGKIRTKKNKHINKLSHLNFEDFLRKTQFKTGLYYSLSLWEMHGNLSLDIIKRISILASNKDLFSRHVKTFIPLLEKLITASEFCHMYIEQPEMFDSLISNLNNQFKDMLDDDSLIKILILLTNMEVHNYTLWKEADMIFQSSMNTILESIHPLTTQVSINADLDYVSKDIVPVQLVFCLKEENKKKINSHRWLFNAFCPVLQPTVVTLVDVGTRLNNTAIYRLWKVFDMDSNVAGAAGQIKTMKGKWGLKLFNPLVASQNFEYKISNILDKPLESVFGYISVLPGALSAYRYRALKNHEDGTGPLRSYFLGETQEGRDHDVFTANMYLAEDRILCWELVAKRDAKWVLKYVKEATGETDVPEDVSEFISQRRRWLNGAMFAAIYAQLHFYQIWKTKHSVVRKFFLHVEFLYQFIQMLFSWFSIANFVLTFYYLAGSMNLVIKHGEALFIFFKYLIFCDLASLFIISMGNRPQGAKHLFITSMVILSICATYSLICGFVFAFKSLASGTESHKIFVDIVISLLSTYGLYFFSSLMYLDPWHMFTSSIQYFLTLPAFTCTLQIFAFCNTHDVSWGTKGSTQESKQLSKAIVVQGPDGKQIVETDWPQEVDKKFLEIKSRLKEPEFEESSGNEKQSKNDYYRDIRTRIVMIWMLSNLILIMSIIQVLTPQDTDNGYLIFILWSVAALAAFRVVGSMAFLFMKYLRIIVSYRNKVEGSGSWEVSKLDLPNVFHKKG